MRSGSINIKQAAEALGMEPAMLAYQLAGKVILDLLESVSNFNIDFSIQVSGDSDNNSNKFPRSDENGMGMDDDFEDEEDNDYNEQLMEVQPDIIMNDDDDDQIEQFDSIVEEEGVDPILEIEHQGVDPTLS